MAPAYAYFTHTAAPARYSVSRSTTPQGKNVLVTAVKGNFDDAQSGVKAIFTDKAYTDELKGIGNPSLLRQLHKLGPACASGGLLFLRPTCDMANAGAVKFGDEINIAVPTGNFGNILAAYIAKLCGLPGKALHLRFQ